MTTDGLRQDPRIAPALVASQIADHETAAEDLAYLCGYLIEMNAQMTGLTEEHVVEQLARRLGGPGSAGVREPRRPRPSDGPSRADPR